jgi:transforming growth factor-beta-induced protein
MMNTKDLFRVLAVVPLAFAACGDDEGTSNGNGPGNGNGNGEEPGNIVEVAQDAGSFGTLLQTATDLGLASTLSGPGPFTVFAPTDGAFAALQVDLSQVEDAVLANIILAHVASGELDATDLVAAGTVDTLANVTHDFDGSATPPTVRGAAVETTDVDASNGIIHVMDEVIVPPTILEAAGELGFTELAGAIESSSSATQGAVAPDTLAGDMPITVFAPTNDAFAGADLSNEDLDAVLGAHVVVGQVLSSDLSDGQTIQTVQGSELTVGVDGSSVTITDARGNTFNVVTPDVRTLTGTIHAIDGVLLPGEPGPGNIVEVARAAGNFTALLQTATTLGLADTLTGPGPFTVFAPTDTAFGNLPDDLSLVDAAVLTNIVLAHVASGELDAETLTNDGSVDTLANISHAFDGSANPPTVRGAAVATPNVDASNGIIHIMSDVIVPPTILQLAGELGFTELAGAVGNASPAIADALDPDTLGGAAPITVFAPTNDAFAAADLSGEDLDAVLSYHVVPGQVLAEDLEDEQVITTVEGSELTVGIDGSNVTLTDARGNVISVSTPDVRTLSGVIHVVDGVLLPEQLGNIVDVARDAGTFSTLLNVATSLGLVPTLSGPGPLTVFAPTDAAFVDLGIDVSQVDAGIVENVVLAHVASGDLSAADLGAEGSVDTLANITHTFDNTAVPPTVRGAEVAQADVPASNGRIHAMGDVIVPPTILQLVGELGFTELADAVGNASQAIADALDPDTLGGGSPITVFAPTNAAFQGADLSGEDLDGVLSYHVVAGQALAGGLSDGDVLNTVHGGTLTVNIDMNNNVSLTDARGNTVNVTATDVRTLSGVVHVIDGVLLPPHSP